jgi:hypothetical protein
MNVSSLFRSSAVSDVSSVSQVSATRSSQAASSSDVQGDTTQVSGPGQFLAKLQALEESDPAKAKDVLGQIADKLTTAAQGATGSTATQLSDLASKFQTAADTGDLSGLRPSGQASQSQVSGHHHGGGRGHRAYAQQSSQQTDDATSTLMAAVDSVTSEMAS